jgi:hypothetical protein
VKFITIYPLFFILLSVGLLQNINIAISIPYYYVILIIANAVRQIFNTIWNDSLISKLIFLLI